MSITSSKERIIKEYTEDEHDDRLIIMEDSVTKGWSILSLNINDGIIINNPYKVIKLRVLRGVIDILGAELYPSNIIYNIGPSLPSLSLINIKATTIIQPEAEAVSSSSSSSAAAAAEARCGCNNKEGEYVNNNNNNNMYADEKEYISSEYNKDYPVIIALSTTNKNDIIYYYNNIINNNINGYKVFTIPFQWYNTIDYIINRCGLLSKATTTTTNNNNKFIKVMVVGGKGAGKSSFIKSSINGILTRGGRNSNNNKVVVRVIDLDCGQSDISLPGCITLYDYVNISLSPSPTLITSTLPSERKEGGNDYDKSILLHYELYTGGTTPSLNPMDYINKCYKLIDMALMMELDNNNNNNKCCCIPVLINTPGWFSGLGAHILTLLRYYIKPDIVINIGNNNILDNSTYWYDLCNGNNPLIPQGLSTITKGGGQQQQEEVGPYGEDIILPSPMKDYDNDNSNNTLLSIPKSADLRWLRYACYFNSNIIGKPYLWHTVIPHTFFNNNNNNIKLLHINNINNIKIMENDKIIDINNNGNGGSSSIDDDLVVVLDGILVGLLDSNDYLLCQGIIHNINNNIISVWIPKYKNINNNDVVSIVKGNIDWSPRGSSYYTNTNSNTRLCTNDERYFLPHTLKNEPIARGSNPRTDLKRRRLEQRHHHHHHQ